MGEVWNRELLSRVISALILLPLVLVAVALGGALFRGLLIGAGTLMLFEWTTIIGAPPALRRAATMSGLILLAFGALLFADQPGVRDAGLAGGLAALGLAVLGRLFGWREITWICLGLAYVVLPISALMYLRLAPDGLLWVLWTLVVVWASDIGAYFAGRLIGGPKLAPRFSPNKTWAGLGGGLILAVLAAWGGNVLAEVYWPGGVIHPLPGLVFAALMAPWSQIGDLGESAFKRRFGVKDASHLIPGHGGLLDRVDGLVFVAVAVAVYWGINYS